MAEVFHGTLTANAVTTVTMTEPHADINILNRNGAGEIYFRTDGTTPTVGGSNCEVIPAAISDVDVNGGESPLTVKMISNQPCTYSITGRG